WWWGWWRPAPRTEEEITSGVVRADADGRFHVTFTPRPDPGDRPESGVAYRYRLMADVTDPSGETQSGSTGLSVGFAALRAAVVLPPVLDQARLPDTLRVATENLNGTFEAAQGRVRFDLLRDPGRALRERYWARPDTNLLAREDYVRRFPHDPYGDEADVDTWPIARTVAEVAFNTAETRTLRLPTGAAQWPEGVYRVTTTSRDARGRPVESVQVVTITNSRTRTMPMPALVWAVALTESAKPGETALFLVGSSERGARVRVDVEVDGRIVRSEWRTLNGEKQRIEVAVTEEMRGGFGVHLAAVRASRPFTMSFNVSVSTGRDLRVALATFRDKVRPGTEETWTLTVAGEDGERVAAEVVAAMYDASLDAILPHGWGFNPFYGRGLRRAWQATGGFGATGFSLPFPGPDQPGETIQYDDLNRFGFESFNPWQARYARRDRLMLQEGAVAEMAVAPSAAPPPPPGVAPVPTAAADAAANGAVVGQAAGMDKREAAEEARARLGEVQARRNLNETAFFFPQLRTDEQGRVSFTFTMPEALTRWNLFAFAHTTDLRFGQTRGETVTQKDLMVTPNLPRLVREGDRLRLTARVDNRSGRALSGEAALMLFDAATMQPVDARLENAESVRRFTLAADSSVALAWTVAVPSDAAGQGSGAYVARVVARTADFSDGEETLLPVLTNRVLVTETLPLPIRGGQTRTYTLDKLLASGSDGSIQHYRLALEFTPNPAWYAVAALPYLMEYPHEGSEQIFSRFYANSLAAHVANSDPRIREVFEAWRRADAAVLRSNLERN
ncbi:MAG TPA: alpha-2-macroglobulin family protein, partial [Rhodothermales bacterium]|nr:alpha-2-macroglobulin family protein [Rhodothermales bacterium]